MDCAVLQGTAMPDGLDESQQQAWTKDAAFLVQLQDRCLHPNCPLPTTGKVVSTACGALRTVQKGFDFRNT